MAHFGIQTSPLTEQIHIGLVDPNGGRFLDGDDIVDLDQDGQLRPGMEEFLTGLRHEDHTDRSLRVVADHILEHFGGALGIDYKDGTARRTKSPSAKRQPQKRRVGHRPRST